MLDDQAKIKSHLLPANPETRCMPILLHIDASPSYEASISRALSAKFVATWQERFPDGRVVRRDLAGLAIPPVDRAWIGAAFTPADARSEDQRGLLALSDTLIGELLSTDEYVIATPMYNFGIPAALKLWVDQVVRLGETYGRRGHERFGLLSGKKVHVLVASGGVYEAGSPTEKFDFVGPYLRAVLGYMGVVDVTVYAAGGAGSIVAGQVRRDDFLKPHLEAIDRSLKQLEPTA